MTGVCRQMFKIGKKEDKMGDARQKISRLYETSEDQGSYVFPQMFSHLHLDSLFTGVDRVYSLETPLDEPLLLQKFFTYKLRFLNKDFRFLLIKTHTSLNTYTYP